MLFSHFYVPYGLRNTGQCHNLKDSYTCHQLLEYGNQASTCSYSFVSLNSWHFSFSQSKNCSFLSSDDNKIHKVALLQPRFTGCKVGFVSLIILERGRRGVWALCFCFHNALQLRINTEKAGAKSLSVSSAFSSNMNTSKYSDFS